MEEIKEKKRMKTRKNLGAVYIYILQDLIKQTYVNIEKKLCFLDESKRYSFFELYMKYKMK